MDIIDLLVGDHDQLRKELAGIRRTLGQSDLRDKIRFFISKYELHESIEEEILFPALRAFPKDELSEKLMPNYEMTHEKIWMLLDQLVDALGRAQTSDMQQAFFNFSASVEIHLGHEERVLFPTIREIMSRSTLEDLGKNAERRMVKYAGNE